MCACLLSSLTCVSLWPMDCSPPSSSVHGILQARTLEWVAVLSFRGSSQPRDQARVSYVFCIGTWEVPMGSPILRICLMKLQQVWNPQSMLESQTKVNASALRQSLSFTSKPPFLFLRPSTDWPRPTNISWSSIFYLKSTDVDVNHIYRILSQQYLHSVWIKELVPSQVDT